MKRKSLPHIGSKEVISFYKEGILDVPAKVDTGADYSAVWASDVVEEDGRLSYCLFAPGSKYYTGERLITDDYGITQVKNSFGHVEQRYKVKHSITLGKKKIKVEFRLADRSNNRYPVLIGKQTLTKRYIVDVSINNILRDAKRRVLVLVNQTDQDIDDFFADINRLESSIDCQVHSYDQMEVVIDNEQGISVINRATKRDVNEYDLIYFKSYTMNAEQAAVIAEYAQSQGISFVSQEVANYHYRSKLAQYARLIRNDIAVPLTVAPASGELPGAYRRLVKRLGSPFVFKDGTDNKGQNNHLIASKADFDRVVESIDVDRRQYYIAQNYIENDGDYRLMVLDKDVRLAIKRRRTSDDTHLNNISAGGRAELMPVDDLPAAVQAMAIRAALLTDHQIAGVDVIQDKKTGDWYLMEVNTGPQLATSSHVNEQAAIMANFLKRNAEK